MAKMWQAPELPSLSPLLPARLFQNLWSQNAFLPPTSFHFLASFALICSCPRPCFPFQATRGANKQSERMTHNKQIHDTYSPPLAGGQTGPFVQCRFNATAVELWWPRLETGLAKHRLSILSWYVKDASPHNWFAQVRCC